MKRVQMLLELFEKQATISRAIHPVALSLQFGIITALRVSKKHATQTFSQRLSVPLENILAVGDSTSDWKFMELFGYTATLSNGATSLHEHIVTKMRNGYVSKQSVDDDGIIDICKHFHLLA